MCIKCYDHDAVELTKIGKNGMWLWQVHNDVLIEGIGYPPATYVLCNLNDSPMFMIDYRGDWGYDWYEDDSEEENPNEKHYIDYMHRIDDQIPNSWWAIEAMLYFLGEGGKIFEDSVSQFCYNLVAEYIKGKSKE